MLSSITLFSANTELQNCFPSVQFMLRDHEVRARRDMNKNEGGLIEYVRISVICKRLKHLEAVVSESICSEITITKKNWFCISIYRPVCRKCCRRNAAAIAEIENTRRYYK